MLGSVTFSAQIAHKRAFVCYADELGCLYLAAAKKVAEFGVRVVGVA